MKEFIRDDVYTLVEDILAKVLDIDKSEIHADSSLINDLGAESIDFLDVMRRIEDELDILLPDANVFEYLTQKYGKEEFFRDCSLNDRGVQILRMAMPEIEPERITTETKEFDIASLITATTFVNLVERYYDVASWKPDKCDRCGSIQTNQIDPNDDDYIDLNLPIGPIFICKNCGELLIPPRPEDQLYEGVVNNPVNA